MTKMFHCVQMMNTNALLRTDTGENDAVTWDRPMGRITCEYRSVMPEVAHGYASCGGSAQSRLRRSGLGGLIVAVETVCSLPGRGDVTVGRRPRIRGQPSHQAKEQVETTRKDRNH